MALKIALSHQYYQQESTSSTLINKYLNYSRTLERFFVDEQIRVKKVVPSFDGSIFFIDGMWIVLNHQRNHSGGIGLHVGILRKNIS